MLDAPGSVWASFATRRNSKDAFQWWDMPFPFYEDIILVYEASFAARRNRKDALQCWDKSFTFSDYLIPLYEGELPSCKSWSKSGPSNIPLISRQRM